jgi:hypothetical protein
MAVRAKCVDADPCGAQGGYSPMTKARSIAVGLVASRQVMNARHDAAQTRAGAKLANMHP